jgi:hypothetical protein
LPFLFSQSKIKLKYVKFYGIFYANYLPECLNTQLFKYTRKEDVKVGVVMDNPIRLRPDQMIKASEAAKKFGYARKKAKDLPQFITENGNIDSVLMGYDYYLKMYQRLIELEEKEESRILNERIERLENDPAQGIPWRTIRRSE